MTRAAEHKKLEGEGTAQQIGTEGGDRIPWSDSERDDVPSDEQLDDDLVRPPLVRVSPRQPQNISALGGITIEVVSLFGPHSTVVPDEVRNDEEIKAIYGTSDANDHTKAWTESSEPPRIC